MDAKQCYLVMDLLEGYRRHIGEYGFPVCDKGVQLVVDYAEGLLQQERPLMFRFSPAYTLTYIESLNIAFTNFPKFYSDILLDIFSMLIEMLVRLDSRSLFLFYIVMGVRQGPKVK